MSNQRDVVLVVEDDPTLQVTVSMILEEAGLEVITASNGLQALEKVAAAMPSVILLDMKMPVMNGWEFAEKFYGRYGRACPVIVLTAAEDAQKRAREIYADDSLGKPFEIDDLVMKVRTNLAKTQPLQSAV